MANRKLQRQQKEKFQRTTPLKKHQKTGQAPERFYNTPFSRPVINSASALDIPLTPHNIRFLQRALGNQTVSRIIQTKLRIGQPNDKYEQEADRVADQVMRMPEPRVQRQPEEKEEEELQTKPLAEQITPLVQRQTEPEEEKEEELAQAKLTNGTQVQRQEEEPEEEEEEEPIQTKLTNDTHLHRQEEEPEEEEEEPIQTKQSGGKTPRVSHGLEAQIHSLKGGGQPLSKADRSFMERRFETDFSGVRVHTDTRAAESARAINAKAFTTGRDVVFGAGQYAPETSKGRQLLVHELTHVVQQESKYGDLKIKSRQRFEPKSNQIYKVMTSAQSSSEQLVAPFLIQRRCQNFRAGWIHPRTGRPGPAGTWCETADEARARVDACPSNCFIYTDGPATHPYRPIPGFPCAHYVAHELGIRVGASYARCLEGFSVTIGQITQGRLARPLTDAQINDIWSDGGHSGVVRRVDVARARVLIEACSVDGRVYRDWASHGNVYRVD
jgi:hypothetical protein